MPVRMLPARSATQPKKMPATNASEPWMGSTWKRPKAAAVSTIAGHGPRRARRRVWKRPRKNVSSAMAGATAMVASASTMRRGLEPESASAIIAMTPWSCRPASSTTEPHARLTPVMPTAAATTPSGETLEGPVRSRAADVDAGPRRRCGR